jgi:hypothetical protein
MPRTAPSSRRCSAPLGVRGRRGVEDPAIGASAAAVGRAAAGNAEPSARGTRRRGRAPRGQAVRRDRAPSRRSRLPPTLGTTRRRVDWRAMKRTSRSRQIGESGSARRRAVRRATRTIDSNYVGGIQETGVPAIPRAAAGPLRPRPRRGLREGPCPLRLSIAKSASGVAAARRSRSSTSRSAESTSDIGSFLAHDRGQEAVRPAASLVGFLPPARARNGASVSSADSSWPCVRCRLPELGELADLASPICAAPGTHFQPFPLRPRNHRSSDPVVEKLDGASSSADNARARHPPAASGASLDRLAGAQNLLLASARRARRKPARQR